MFLRTIFLFVVLLCGGTAIAQPGYTCQDAVLLKDIHHTCTDSAGYSNAAPEQNGKTWFKFVPDSDAVNIIVNGRGAGGSLQMPVIAINSDCTGTDVAGVSNSYGDVSLFYAKGLIPGATYYILVSSANNQNGTFKLCINSSSSEVNASDCDKAIYVASITESYCHGTGGPGTNTHEGEGTCLGGNLQHKVWYKWQASADGPLAFRLTPQSTQGHINFALYDLGVNGDCSNAKASTLIRCLAGYGDDVCPSSHPYSTVGLSANSTDVSEGRTCGQGQDGLLQYMSLVKGHIYALLVTEDLVSDPRFCLTFGFDPLTGNGPPGGIINLGTIQSPPPNFTYFSANPACAAELTYTFSSTTPSYHKLRWDFGAGAGPVTIDALGRYNVRYLTPGVKTVTMYATDDIGYTTAVTKTFTIANPPVIVQPVINVSNNNRCAGDVVQLSTVPVSGLNYIWTGPNNFTSTQTSISVAITDVANAGTYTLTPYEGKCPGPAATIYIPSIANRPVADFTTSPTMTATLISPATVEFANASVNADSYSWDFGDGETATLTNPEHIYTKDGTYNITLTAYQSTACSMLVTKGQIIIRNDLTLFIPNTFTPNSDGTNDTFALNVSNLKTFHLLIYNRWGKPVFESRDVTQKWNGMYNGQPLPVATYYYVLNAVSEGGTAVNRSGYIALLR